MDEQLTPKLRIAPTPSGYLHLGNLYNFVLTKNLARKLNGSLTLRIDDIDHSRKRSEFVDDIFQTLEWLQIDYDHGPKSVSDFELHYSQIKKREHYRTYLHLIEQKFNCRCSRKEVLQVASDGQYPGTCRMAGHSFVKEQTCIRLMTSATFSFDSMAPHQSMRDFVIWTKDDLPSYQLTSLIEDYEQKMTVIVRGEDLRPSTAAQMELAHALSIAPEMERVSWHHHPLIAGEHGQKLSKSKGDLSLRIMRDRGMDREQVYQQLAQALGLEHAGDYQNCADFIELSIP